MSFEEITGVFDHLANPPCLCDFQVELDFDSVIRVGCLTITFGELAKLVSRLEEK